MGSFQSGDYLSYIIFMAEHFDCFLWYLFWFTDLTDGRLGPVGWRETANRRVRAAAVGIVALNPGAGVTHGISNRLSLRQRHGSFYFYEFGLN